MSIQNKIIFASFLASAIAQAEQVPSMIEPQGGIQAINQAPVNVRDFNQPLQGQTMINTSGVMSTLPQGFKLEMKVMNRDSKAIADLATIQVANKIYKPVAFPDGTMVFPYGVGVPTIDLAPGRISSIELKDDEALKDIFLSAPNGEFIQTKSTKSAEGMPETIYLRPGMDSGYITDIVITTTKRKYKIRGYVLNDKEQKAAKNFNQSIAFSYPGEVQMYSGNRMPATSSFGNQVAMTAPVTAPSATGGFSPSSIFSALPAPTALPVKAAKTEASFVSANTVYGVKSKANILPNLFVVDDNNKTYIYPGKKLNLVPFIEIENQDGSVTKGTYEKRVNPNSKEDVFVMDGTYYRIKLNYPDLNEIITITNKKGA